MSGTPRSLWAFHVTESAASTPASSERWALRERDRGAEGAVDVKPEPFLASDLADLRQRIEGAQHGRRRRGVDHDGTMARRAVLGDRGAKQRHIHAPAGIDSDLAHVLAPDPDQACRFRNRVVRIHRCVDRHRRGSQAAITRVGKGLIASHDHGHEVRHRTAGCERPVAGVPAELGRHVLDELAFR